MGRGAKTDSFQFPSNSGNGYSSFSERWRRRMVLSSEHKEGQSRDVGTSSATSRLYVDPLGLSRLNVAFTRCGTHLRLTICGKAEACSTSRRCSVIQRWK